LRVGDWRGWFGEERILSVYVSVRGQSGKGLI